MTSLLDADEGPLLLPSPRALLASGEVPGASAWAIDAARGLGALLAMGPTEPRLEDLAPLRREALGHAGGLTPEPAERALTALQREYDVYFTTARRGPTLDALSVGLVQAAYEVLQELALPCSLAPVERLQLLAGLETAALLLSRGLVR